jgi:hypothetical protein
MRELMLKCELVAERLANNPDQAFVVHTFGRLLDLVEVERAELMAAKPKREAPDWERAYSWHARSDVRDATNAVKCAKGMYFGESGAQWLDDLETITRKIFSGADLWRQWDTVQESRQRFVRLADTATARQRIDAQTVLAYTEALYDLMTRRYRRQSDRPRLYYAENRLRGLRPPRQSRTKPGRSRPLSKYVPEPTL